MKASKKRAVKIQHKGEDAKESLVETILWEFFTNAGIGVVAALPLAVIAIYKRLRYGKRKEEPKPGKWVVQVIERTGLLRYRVISEEGFMTEAEASRRYWQLIRQIDVGKATN